MRRTITAVALASGFILGCGGGSEPVTPLKVMAGVVNMSGLTTTTVLVEVTESGLAVTDATVTVNGQTIVHTGGGSYELTYSPAIGEGATVTLTVTRGGVTVSGSVMMPEEPTVTEPAPLSSHSASLPITVTWNPMSLTPDSVWVLVDAAYTQSGNLWETEVPGTSTSLQIPAYTLNPSQSAVAVGVMSWNRTVSLGPDAEAGSEFDACFGAIGGPFSTTP